MTSETKIVELFETVTKQDAERQQAFLDLQKQTTEAIAALTKHSTELTEKIDSMSGAISETIKTTIAGQTMENKPKEGGSKDIGDPVKAPNALAPGQPGPEQTAPLSDASGSDRGGLSMENKALIEEVVSAVLEKKGGMHKEDDKEEMDKEDTSDMPVKKEDDEEEEDDSEKKMSKADSEGKTIEKSDTYEYEVVKAVRSPYLDNRTVKEGETIPNGYQLLKATMNGWGGKYKTATESWNQTLRVVQSLGGLE